MLKEELCISFVDLEKTLDSAKKVEIGNEE